jgi:hypothetical protein
VLDPYNRRSHQQIIYGFNFLSVWTQLGMLTRSRLQWETGIRVAQVPRGVEIGVHSTLAGPLHGNGALRV